MSIDNLKEDYAYDNVNNLINEYKNINNCVAVNNIKNDIYEKNNNDNNINNLFEEKIKH